MLLDTLRDDIKTAMRAKDDITKNVLRVAVGEAETVRGTKGKLEDSDVIAILRKMIAGNNETMARGDEALKSKLTTENGVLEKYLPRYASAETIEQKLRSEPGALASITEAAKDGQAVGIAMKSLRDSGLVLDGAVVKTVVEKLRAPITA